MTKSTTIATLTETRYGVNALTCESIVIEWAAGVLAETVGVEKAASEWKRINARRNKLGKYTTIPQWGTPMFDAYFAKKAA